MMRIRRRTTKDLGASTLHSGAMTDTIPANAVARAVMAYASIARRAIFLGGGVAGVEALEDVALALARQRWRCDVGDFLGGRAS